MDTQPKELNSQLRGSSVNSRPFSSVSATTTASTPFVLKNKSHVQPKADSTPFVSDKSTLKITKNNSSQPPFLFTPSLLQNTFSILFPLPLGEGFRVRATGRVGVRSQLNIVILRAGGGSTSPVGAQHVAPAPSVPSLNESFQSFSHAKDGRRPSLLLSLCKRRGPG